MNVVILLRAQRFIGFILFLSKNMLMGLAAAVPLFEIKIKNCFSTSVKDMRKFINTII